MLHRNARMGHVAISLDRYLRVVGLLKGAEMTHYSP